MKSVPKTASIALVVVAAHLVTLGVLALDVGWTPDEFGYYLSGRNLLAGAGWDTPEQRFQGPLGLLANQLWPVDVPAGITSPTELPKAVRLGMLVFPLALLGVVGLWARALWGSRGAVLAVLLAVTSPTLLAYGPLLACDVALTAATAATFFALWRWFAAPSWPRVAVLGLATGAMLATKYTSLLFVVALGLAAVVAVLRGFDPRRGATGRALVVRLGAATASLVAVGGVALLTLNACYLFDAPRFDAAQASALTSGAFGALARLPGGAALLSLLPDPFVLGADYQATVSRDFAGKFLDVDGAHWAYYPASLLTKTPLGTLALCAFAFLGPRQIGSARVPPFAGVALGVPAVVLLGYLSVASSLQMGIRYLLPILPLGFVFAGRCATTTLATRPLGRLVGAAALVSCVAAAVLPFPHHIGYFNLLVGGPAGGFRLFADGNCDWGQRFAAGQVALRARDPDVEFLRPGSDPRFGRVAGYALDLKPADPQLPGHTYHWVTRFPVVDHDSAAWLVFDVTPAGFEAAVAHGDGRAAQDLACAYLRGPDVANAERALAQAPDDATTTRLRALIGLADRAAAGEATARRAVVEGLAALGHAELALRYVGDAPRADLPELFVLLTRSGRLPEAVGLLESRRADGTELTPIEVLLLGTGLFWQAKPIEALAVLEAGPAPAADDPLAPIRENFLEQVRQAVRAIEKLKQTPTDR